MRPATLVFLALAACSDPPPSPPAAHRTADAAVQHTADTRRREPSAPDARAVHRTAAAARCRLHGEPLARACDAPSGAIAVAADGRVHVAIGEEVRRYRRIDGEGCDLEVEGTVAVPVVEPPGQVLGKGPVYMQSGGPQWKVTGTGGRLFLHEYLRGIHEIVGDRVRPVCPQLQGVGRLALLGKKAYVARNRGEEVTLGGRCQTRAAGFEPRPHFGLYAVGGALVGSTGGEAVLYGADLAAVATLGGGDSFAPGGLCSVVAAVPCGDDICVADGNCMKVNRYASDGSFVAALEGAALFDPRPFGLLGAAAGPDGIYLLVANRDGAICEDAVHLLPSP